jgi:hypothetical protein
MWKFIQEKEGMSLYKGQVIETSQGLRARVRGISDFQNKEVVSGVIALKKTKFSFYSKSSLVYVMIEMSKEMFDFDESSNFMQVEKCIHFIRGYLERCKAESASHEVVFMLYGRLYYPQITSEKMLLEELRKKLDKQDYSMHDLKNNHAFKLSKESIVF